MIINQLNKPRIFCTRRSESLVIFLYPCNKEKVPLSNIILIHFFCQILKNKQGTKKMIK